MLYYILEIKKLLRLPSLRYATLFTWCITLFVIFWPLFSTNRNSFSMSETFLSSFRLIIFCGYLLMTLVTVQYIYGEFLNRTAQMNLAFGISRFKFLYAKALSLITATYIMLFILSITSFILTSIVALILNKFELGSVHYGYLTLSLLLAPLKFFPFMFMAFFLTVVFRSPILPISVTLFYALVGEPLLDFALRGGRFYKYIDLLPGKALEPLNYIFEQVDRTQLREVLEFAASRTGTPTFLGIASSLLYLTSFLLISIYIFKSQDLSK